MKKILCVFVAMSALAGPLQAANYCGELVFGHGAYGPFDYRKRSEGHLDVVEQAHFKPDVESGSRSIANWVGDDLSYTLLAIPNHHRALGTLVKIAVGAKTLHIAHMKYPVECYFNRAIRYVPDDGMVRAIYADYLFRVKQPEKALEMLKQAIDLEPENAAINYNLGLMYMKKSDYQQAAIYAHKAYGLGFPLPGLKKMLVEAGKWEEKAPE